MKEGEEEKRRRGRGGLVLRSQAACMKNRKTEKEEMASPDIDH